MRNVCFLLCALFLFQQAASGANPTGELPPCPTRYFTDSISLLTPAYVEEKNRLLESFEHASSNQFIVAIFEKLPPDTSIEDYCSRIFNSWGVGLKGINNGVVLFVFVESHKIRIEIGRGLPGVLTNAKSKEIVDRMAKFFKEGNFPAGFDLGVSEIIDVLKANGKGDRTEKGMQKSDKAEKGRTSF